MSLSLADIDKFMDAMYANARADPELLYVKVTDYRHLMHIRELQKRGICYVPSKRKKHKSPERMPKDLREEARKYQAYRREKRKGPIDDVYWTLFEKDRGEP